MPEAVKPVQEGSRWRHAKPSADEVAEWFKSVPLDEGMSHEDYVAGVVLIPASEKVKHPRADGTGTDEKWEQTFTPYVRVDTRISYFRKLAELRQQVPVIEPVVVPTVEEGAFANKNLPAGFFWHVAGAGADAERFLCATWRVALYDKEAWTARQVAESKTEWDRPRPLREGVGTKQVTGAPEINALARAETGAIGRALGVAGILVIGTGIATADDMQEFSRESGGQVTLPAAVEDEVALNERIMALQARLRPLEAAWQEFAAWWQERSRESGWSSVMDAPVEVRRGIASKMEGLIGVASPPEPSQDSSSVAQSDGS